MWFVLQADSKYCRRLATIVDKQTRVSKDVTVCTDRRHHQRSASLITADSATVEVRLYSSSTSPSHATAAAAATASGQSFGTASHPVSLLKYEGRSSSAIQVQRSAVSIIVCRSPDMKS